ncbi:MAG: KUP/HAK/KT family potassium transporter, partial [Oligoflexia bacterium]|nr:KUP/HAK/KT family potassium transporter [Oligoflexia bacterium]
MQNNSTANGKTSLKFLVIGALGIVFGDIGTSPLYALRECFTGNNAFETNALNILGAVSLIFWALVLIISIKYVSLILNADNKGEGGVLALMTLLTRLRRTDNRKIQIFFIFIGLFATSMLFGDGLITPAISVLSAVEGLNVATSVFKPYVVPISIVVLSLLFLFQRNGTEKVGYVFGPVIVVWFLTLAVLGMRWIVIAPEVLKALNPYYSILFFIHHGWHGFVILGAVFLSITGAEAIYADMGHFGKTPIRYAWFFFVLPGLVLNYFGQAAYLLKNPENIENLFYRLAPEWALYPLVIIATCATIIASQAVISGAFSLTRQAVQLGYLP